MDHHGTVLIPALNIYAVLIRKVIAFRAVIVAFALLHIHFGIIHHLPAIRTRTIEQLGRRGSRRVEDRVRGVGG